MSNSNLLGEYLRARRERVSPADAGLAPGPRRRVSGLRREEVALLAGISADYYLRLEQGRDRNPSRQVLEALARILCPDETARRYLLTLGDPPPDATVREVDAAPASIVSLISAMSLPAFVQDRHMDVLASNPLARALSPTLTTGGNRLIAMFTDPDEQRMFLDWEVVVAELVASFRSLVASSAGDPRTVELVAELSDRSARFAQLWASHDVENRVDRPPVRMLHPTVGEVTLTRDNLAIDGPDGLRLVVYHAESGTESAARLAKLGSR